MGPRDSRVGPSQAVPEHWLDGLSAASPTRTGPIRGRPRRAGGTADTSSLGSAAAAERIESGVWSGLSGLRWQRPRPRLACSASGMRRRHARRARGAGRSAGSGARPSRRGAPLNPSGPRAAGVGRPSARRRPRSPGRGRRDARPSPQPTARTRRHLVCGSAAGRPATRPWARTRMRGCGARIDNRDAGMESRTTGLGSCTGCPGQRSRWEFAWRLSSWHACASRTRWSAAPARPAPPRSARQPTAATQAPSTVVRRAPPGGDGRVVRWPIVRPPVAPAPCCA